MRLALLGFIAVIAVPAASQTYASVSTPGGPPPTRRYVKTLILRESSGRVEATVRDWFVFPSGPPEPARSTRDLAALHPADSVKEVEINTPAGAFEIRIDTRREPDADGNVATAEIRSVGTGRKLVWASGPLAQNHDKPDLLPELVFKRMVIRAGEVSLSFPELKADDLLAAKSTERELAAFREAVPEELQAFCELLVRASDLLQLDDAALLLARFSAPKGTRMDASRQGWYVSDEKRSVELIPAEPPPESDDEAPPR